MKSIYIKKNSNTYYLESSWFDFSGSFASLRRLRATGPVLLETILTSWAGGQPQVAGKRKISHEDEAMGGQLGSHHSLLTRTVLLSIIGFPFFFFLFWARGVTRCLSGYLNFLSRRDFVYFILSPSLPIFISFFFLFMLYSFADLFSKCFPLWY